MIERTVVGLGGKPFTPVAVQQVVRSAKRYDADITVVNVQRLAHNGPVLRRAGQVASELWECRISVTREKVQEADCK